MSLNDFIAASKSLVNKSLPAEQLNGASRFMYEVKANPDTLPLLIDALKTDSPEAQHFSLIILKDKIASSISPDLSKAIRDTLLGGLYSGTLEAILLDDVVRVLGLIACFEWPEIWTEFGELIKDQTRPIQATTYLLSSFLETINLTDKITEARRQLLSNRISAIALDIFPIIVASLQDINLAPVGLRSLNYLLSTIPAHFINEDLIRTLCFTYLQHLPTHEQTIKCLQSLFCDRNDSIHFIYKHGGIILNAFAPRNTFKENGVPISSTGEALQFIINVLTQYYILYISSIDPLVLAIGRPRIDFQDNPIELCKQDLISLFQVVLSNSRPEIPSWDLWLDMLRRYLAERNMPVEPPIVSFFKPLFPNIVQCLYNFLGEACAEDGSLLFSARSCWGLLARIDMPAILAFLKEQPISASYGYALGCFQFLDGHDTAMDSISSILIEALNNPAISDPKIAASILFALSRTIWNLQLFRSFIDFTLRVFQSSDVFLLNSATHSLAYVARNDHSKKFFFEDDMSIVDELLSVSETIFGEHPKPEKFYKIISGIIKEQLEMEQPHERAQELFNEMASPFVPQINTENPELPRALVVIDTISSMLPQWSQAIFYEPLKAALLQWIPNPNIPYEIMDPLMDAVALLCQPPDLPQFADAMAKHGHPQDSFYKFFAVVRGRNECADALYPSVKAFLLDPLNFDDPSDFPLGSIIEMLSKFSPGLLDVEWVIHFSVIALADLHESINNQIVDFLFSFIYSRDETEQIVAAFGGVLLAEALKSITDAMHKPAFNKLVEFVFRMILAAPDHMAAIGQLIEILKGLIGEEPVPNFYADFGNKIAHLVQTFDLTDFPKLFNDMLVLAKRMTPSDSTRLFSLRRPFNPMNYQSNVRRDLYEFDQLLLEQMAIEESLMPAPEQLVMPPPEEPNLNQ